MAQVSLYFNDCIQNQSHGLLVLQRFKCGSDANIDVITILRDMLRSGNFYPTMWWIMPSNGSGLSQERLEVLFNIMRDWESTTRSDVRTIFMAPDIRFTDMHMELAEQSSVVKLRHWQQELVDATLAEPHPRAVMWWWEPLGNAGKTFLARHLMFHHKAVLVQLMKKDDMLHVLSKSITAKTRIVIFDLVRTTVEDGYDVVYQVMEMLKDRLLCSGKYSSVSMHLKPLHVIVFSNNMPDLTKMSADRWIVKKIDTSDEPTSTSHESLDHAAEAFQTPQQIPNDAEAHRRRLRVLDSDSDSDDVPTPSLPTPIVNIGNMRARPSTTPNSEVRACLTPRPRMTTPSDPTSRGRTSREEIAWGKTPVVNIGNKRARPSTSPNSEERARSDLTSEADHAGPSCRRRLRVLDSDSDSEP